MRLILILMMLSGCTAKTKAIVTPIHQTETIDYRKDSNLEIIKEPDALNKLSKVNSYSVKKTNNPITPTTTSNYASKLKAETFKPEPPKYTTHNEWLKDTTEAQKRCLAKLKTTK